ncbi:MAG: hypothetical protein FD160_2351 [Caulobacteraceae bacterium]|nr:MAG: hypothetical protein FD160_2351 [Caulobacteraceae bacterium]
MKRNSPQSLKPQASSPSPAHSPRASVEPPERFQNFTAGLMTLRVANVSLSAKCDLNFRREAICCGEGENCERSDCLFIKSRVARIRSRCSSPCGRLSKGSRWDADAMGQRRRNDRKPTADLRQLGLPFETGTLDASDGHGAVAAPSPVPTTRRPQGSPGEPAHAAHARATSRAAPSAPTSKPTQRSWPGFKGQRPPRPHRDEIPLNTKRAAHWIGRSARWMELVRYNEGSPPWLKKGGQYEYYPSQLDWWRDQLADSW